MNQIYTINQINDLVLQYQQNKQANMLHNILAAFEGYIMKYVMFIKYGVTHGDAELIECQKILYSVNIQLNDSTMMAQWEIDDIKDELILLFIDMLNKFQYRKNGPTFVGYIKSCFKYAVKAWLQQVRNEILNQNNNIVSIDNVTPMMTEPEVEEIKETLLEYNDPVLSKIEKNVLYLYYERGKSIQDIADIMGASRQHIHAIKTAALEKLKTTGIILAKMRDSSILSRARRKTQICKPDMDDK